MGLAADTAGPVRPVPVERTTEQATPPPGPAASPLPRIHSPADYPACDSNRTIAYNNWTLAGNILNATA